MKKVPLKRMATENDIAKAMLFLSSDLSSCLWSKSFWSTVATVAGRLKVSRVGAWLM